MSVIIAHILDRAADQLEAQPELWKSGGENGDGCTCIAIAIQDQSWNIGGEPRTAEACRAVAWHLGLTGTRSDFATYGPLPEWNDRPETTLADAVAACRDTAKELRS